MNLSESTKDLGDAAALGAVVGTWTSILPNIAALLAIIWTLIRIYEWSRIRIFKLEASVEKPKKDFTE